MSERNHYPTPDRRMAGCEGKIAYASRGEVDRVVEHLRARKRNSAKAYRCQFCRKYHVGRMSIA